MRPRLLLPLACLLVAAAAGSAAEAPKAPAPANDGTGHVFSEDFENFDRRRWNEILDKGDAVQDSD